MSTPGYETPNPTDRPVPAPPSAAAPPPDTPPTAPPSPDAPLPAPGALPPIPANTQGAYDPTAVGARRSLAWLIDAVIFAILFLTFTAVGPFGSYEDRASLAEAGLSLEDGCEAVEDTTGARQCFEAPDAVPFLQSDRIYYVENGYLLLGVVASAAYFVLVYVVVQGVTGATAGKYAMGVRVVDDTGHPPGMGRSLTRSVLWIVDGTPWIFPAVAFVVSLVSVGHRRIGDMAADTFVVRVTDVGQRLRVPGYTAATAPGLQLPGQPGASTSPGGDHPAPPAQSPYEPRPETAQAPPAPATVRPSPLVPPSPDPSSPPTLQPSPEVMAQVEAALADVPPTDEPAPSEPAADPPAANPRATDTPAAEAPVAEPPAAETSAPPGEPATGAPTANAPVAAGAAPATPELSAQTPSEAAPPAAPAPASPTPPTYAPQWDPARNAYIQWDPARGRWLQWDTTAQRWHAI